jgi:hypothetical protein
LQTPEGKKLYALRKQVPEPVFGIIKSVLGLWAVSAAWDRPGSRRVEPCDHGPEHEPAVRPSPRLRRGERRSQSALRRLSIQAATVEAQSNAIFWPINGQANGIGKINRLKIPSLTVC